MTDADDRLVIGRWIEHQRKGRKWSQTHLAVRAGVSLNTVYLVESGANSHVSSILAIVHALNGRLRVLDSVPPDEIPHIL